VAGALSERGAVREDFVADVPDVEQGMGLARLSPIKNR